MLLPGPLARDGNYYYLTSRVTGPWYSFGDKNNVYRRKSSCLWRLAWEVAVRRVKFTSVEPPGHPPNNESNCSVEGIPSEISALRYAIVVVNLVTD